MKRITAVNGQPTNPNDGTMFNQFVDDIVSPSAANDNHPSWPANYLLGAFDAGITKPGDELEYTVYFLSSGNLAAGDVRVCDRIPTHTQFINDAYNSLAPANTGGGNRGILLNFNGQQFGLTNADDGDEIADTGGNDNGIGGYYFPAGVNSSTAFPGITTSCSGTNDNGTNVVDLSDIPNATGNGTPIDSYGFIRFRVVAD